MNFPIYRLPLYLVYSLIYIPANIRVTEAILKESTSETPIESGSQDFLNSMVVLNIF